jgi:Flp pilus assembly protein TadG
MKKQRTSQSGASVIEFAFITFTLVPLLIGAAVVGVNLVRTLQTEQLARDAGHMFARGVDFSASGNQEILANIGSSLNLSATAGSGNATVILSKLTYVDSNACTTGGAVNGGGQPSGCTNLGKWVFVQRLVVGNSAIRSSNLGTPTGVTLSSNGSIAASQYVTVAGDVANFNSINPYSNVSGTISGLPSGQFVYVAEASGTGYSIPPYGVGSTYAFGLF